MKKIITLIFSIISLGLVIFYLDDITDKLAELLRNQPKVVISKPNNYYKNNSFKYVKLSKDYIPYSKQDILDIFYSILNSGYETFTFYCPVEYTDCLKDVERLSIDTDTFTHINNYVSPFNNFSNIKVIYSSTGEINVEITKLYSESEIKEVNNKLDEIMSNIIKEDSSTEDKILAFHDYVINNTKYDKDRKNNNNKYKSNIAYGALLEGYAVCGGYADAMALFLNRLNVPNYKVASKTHVWNAVYLDEKWVHLDLTWDDPITNNSDKDTLLHKFYLIDTEKLESYKIEDHEYDKTIYQELS